MIKFVYKKSNINGYGLFTTKDIKKGEIICYYFGKKVKNSKLIFNTYALHYDENTLLIGETDIKKLPEEGYGQFLNDGGFIEMDSKIFINSMNSFITYDNMEASLAESVDETIIDLLSECLFYKFNSSKNNNVKFSIEKKIDKVFIISLRDIKKGEEMFVTYGFRYWLAYYIEKYKEHLFNRQTATKILFCLSNIIEKNLQLIVKHVRKRLESDEQKLKVFDEFIKLSIENNVNFFL